MKSTGCLTLVLLVCLLQSVQAQFVQDSLYVMKDTLRSGEPVSAEPVNKSIVRKSHFETSVNYQSNDVYLGRKDSSVLPYFIPEISFYHSSGIFVSASLYYLKNQTTSRIDLFTIDAGYHFTAGQYNGQLTLSKYFYNSHSTSVTSDISASAEYQNDFDFGFIKTTFTATLNIGSKPDGALLLALEHRFTLIKDKLDITPAVTVGGSTQNFYSDYYKTRRYTLKRKMLAGQSGTENISGTVVNASSFKILDYETGISLAYNIGKCEISFIPTYSIPVNPSQLDIQTTKANGTVITRTKTEQLENTFFWTLGISILF